MSAAKIAKLPPIRHDELERLGRCGVCGGTQLNGGVGLFYRVTIERAGFDRSAVMRAAGFAQALGPLAPYMGPDEPLARVIDGPVSVFVHEGCAGRIDHLLQLFPKETKHG